MPKLIWDQIGEREYETGVSHVVLYPMEGSNYSDGEAWNGFTGFSPKPKGAEPKALYANNGKYLTLMSAEEFDYNIKAYTYPDGFKACNGEAEVAKGVVAGQQPRKPFGLAVRTEIGNDTEGTKHGYKLHLIYNSLVSPSEKEYATINNDPNAMDLSWDASTTPVSVAGFEPTSYLCIESTTADPTKLAALEAVLYGSAEPDSKARLPLPEEVITMMGEAE